MCAGMQTRSPRLYTRGWYTRRRAYATGQVEKRVDLRSLYLLTRNQSGPGRVKYMIISPPGDCRDRLVKQYTDHKNQAYNNILLVVC